MKRNLPLSKVAEVLECDVRTVRRLIDEGELIAFKLRDKPGSALRVPEEALEIYRRRLIVKYQLNTPPKDENDIFDERKPLF